MITSQQIIDYVNQIITEGHLHNVEITDDLRIHNPADTEFYAEVILGRDNSTVTVNEIDTQRPETLQGTGTEWVGGLHDSHIWETLKQQTYALAEDTEGGPEKCYYPAEACTRG